MTNLNLKFYILKVISPNKLVRLNSHNTGSTNSSLNIHETMQFKSMLTTNNDTLMEELFKKHSKAWKALADK